MTSFNSHLAEAGSVLDLTRILGGVCIDRGDRLQEALEDETERKLIDAIAAEIMRASPDALSEAVRRPDRLHRLLGLKLAELLGKADAAYPLDCLAVLRGICPRLHDLYEEAGGEVVLDRGTPVPFATRPVNTVFEANTYQPTQNNNTLLRGCAARQFEYSATEQLRVALDYTEAERLDALGWSKNEKLPRIATVHPEGSMKLSATPEDGGKLFFDARPESWDPDDVLGLLRQVADVEIAILPELSVGDVEEVGEALGGAPADFPDLVVAGSIHVREGGSSEIRANESRIFLHGELVGRARKHHKFEARELNGVKLRTKSTENLSAEAKTLTILSGTKTRLAVVICADLVDAYAPPKAAAAGVNLLLAPSYTPKPGSFAGAATLIATSCQGVAVISNAPPADAPRSFHAIAAVPRESPAEISAMFPLSGTSATRIAVIDPNLAMNDPKVVEWR